ncbi:MAG: alpha/beta fold hydrolase [Desulfosarcina sp.]
MTHETQQHRVSFVAHDLRLSGVLHLPKNEPVAVIIGCHGLMADKNSPKQIELARQCTARGMAYFRFDHRGCGQSEGDFDIDTTVAARRSDLIAAVRAVNQVIGKKVPLGLFGSSLGGTVSLSAAGDLAPFAVVTLAAPIHDYFINVPHGMPPSLTTDRTDRRLTFDISQTLGAIDHLLVIHGSADETVSVDHAHRIHRLAGAPKRLLILDGADHRISSAVHQKSFLEAAVNWFADCHAESCRGEEATHPTAPICGR